MSTRSVPLRIPEAQRRRPELVQVRPRAFPLTALRAGIWGFGILLAAAQAWAFRYYVSADAISYLDMSDGVMPGGDWHRLINGIWSPLYPSLLGIVRSAFNISPANEIVAGHLLNLPFFIFAFGCFEFLLRSALRNLALRLPTWAVLSIVYALFLWASIGMITLTSLRADMLMSGFVYLATGMLVRMQGRLPQWSSYCTLGVIIGIGTLAKTPVLPLGLIILAASLFAVQNRQTALKMVAVSLLILLSIGSLYFVPLSRARHKLSFGESGKFNYLLYVNHVRPAWYVQNIGTAGGKLLHPPEKINSSPSAYAFSHSSLVTHPLRFDPSDWIVGARPRLAFKDQLRTCLATIRKLSRHSITLGPVLLCICFLSFLSWRDGRLVAGLRRAWTVWIVGLAGCLMYLLLNVEPRYVGSFLSLFCLGLILSFDIPAKLSRRAVAISTVLVVVVLLAPLAATSGIRFFKSLGGGNGDAEAAMELSRAGIRPGDKVARISGTVTDLGIERIARVEVIGEVGIGDAQLFWNAAPETQQAILQLFASRGARAVVATAIEASPATHSQWNHLGSTRYWAWYPKSPAPQGF